MPLTDRAIVIHSPHSGRAIHFDQALTDLRQHNVDITRVVSIAELDGLLAQGPIWKDQGINAVIAAGGDGLIGGVITHIAESGLPLGIIPLGTSNDIARTLHIPQNLQRAAEVIANGRIIEIDVGVAQPSEQAPHQANPHPGMPDRAQIASNQQSFFAHVLTVGLNVQFARLATSITTRQRFGKLTYPIAALEIARNHKPIELDICIDRLALPAHEEPTATTDTRQIRPTILTEQVRFHCNVLQATVINAPIFGGQWQISLPKADIFDHLLDIVLIADIRLESLVDAVGQLFGKLQTPRNLHASWHTQYALHPLLQQAELSGIQGVYHFQAQGIIMGSNVDPQDVTLDGEIRGQTPLGAYIAPQPLHVIVPDNRNKEHKKEGTS